MAALKVFNTGDSAMRTKNIKIDDFRVLVPAQSRSVNHMASKFRNVLTICTSLYQVRIRTIK